MGKSRSKARLVYLVMSFYLLGISVLEILAYLKGSVFSLIASRIWLGSALVLLLLFAAAVFRQIREDIRTKELPVLFCFLLLLSFFVFCIGNLLVADINPDAATQLAAGLEAFKEPDFGYTGTAFLGYPVRQYLLAAIPTLLFGRSVFSFHLGFAWPFLIGLTFLFLEIRAWLRKWELSQLLALLPVSALLVFPFITEYYRDFEQAITPVALTMLAIGLYLRLVRKQDPATVYALSWVGCLFADSYTPGLASMGLLLAFLGLYAFGYWNREEGGYKGRKKKWSLVKSCWQKKSLSRKKHVKTEEMLEEAVDQRTETIEDKRDDKRRRFVRLHEKARVRGAKEQEIATEAATNQGTATSDLEDEEKVFKVTVNHEDESGIYRTRKRMAASIRRWAVSLPMMINISVFFAATLLKERGDKITEVREGVKGIELVREIGTSWYEFFTDTNAVFLGLFAGMAVLFVLLSLLWQLRFHNFVIACWILGVVFLSSYMKGYTTYEKSWILQRNMIIIPVLLVTVFFLLFRFMEKQRWQMKRQVVYILFFFSLAAGIFNLFQVHQSFTYFRHVQPMKYLITYIEDILEEKKMKQEDSFTLIVFTDSLLQSNMHDYAKYFFPHAECSSYRTEEIPAVMALPGEKPAFYFSPVPFGGKNTGEPVVLREFYDFIYDMTVQWYRTEAHT